MSQYGDILPRRFSTGADSRVLTFDVVSRERQVNEEELYHTSYAQDRLLPCSMAYPLKHRDTMPMRPLALPFLFLSLYIFSPFNPSAVPGEQPPFFDGTFSLLAAINLSCRATCGARARRNDRSAHRLIPRRSFYRVAEIILAETK